MNTLLLKSPAFLTNVKTRVHLEISHPLADSVGESLPGLLGAYHHAGQEFLALTPTKTKEWIKKTVHISMINATYLRLAVFPIKVDVINCTKWRGITILNPINTIQIEAHDRMTSTIDDGQTGRS